MSQAPWTLVAGVQLHSLHEHLEATSRVYSLFAYARDATMVPCCLLMHLKCSTLELLSCGSALQGTQKTGQRKAKAHEQYGIASIQKLGRSQVWCMSSDIGSCRVCVG